MKQRISGNKTKLSMYHLDKEATKLDRFIYQQLILWMDFKESVLR